MFKILFLVVLSLSNASYSKSDLRMADIGFRGVDTYISIELTSVAGEDGFKFSFASTNAPGKNVPISSCAYFQKYLETEINDITDPKVKADFNWIFLRSDYSGNSIETFYPEFKSLLERANPKCAVKDLQQLRDQLAGAQLG